MEVGRSNGNTAKDMIATIQSLKTISEVTPTANWVGSALVLALISMIAVAGVFYYLNRQLKRQYLTLWTIAWICYATHLLAAMGLQKVPDLSLLLPRPPAAAR